MKIKQPNAGNTKGIENFLLHGMGYALLPKLSKEQREAIINSNDMSPLEGTILAMLGVNQKPSLFGSERKTAYFPLPTEGYEEAHGCRYGVEYIDRRFHGKDLHKILKDINKKYFRSRGKTEMSSESVKFECRDYNERGSPFAIKIYYEAGRFYLLFNTKKDVYEKIKDHVKRFNFGIGYVAENKIMLYDPINVPKYAAKKLAELEKKQRRFKERREKNKGKIEDEEIKTLGEIALLRSIIDYKQAPQRRFISEVSVNGSGEEKRVISIEIKVIPKDDKKAPFSMESVLVERVERPKKIEDEDRLTVQQRSEPKASEDDAFVEFL